MSTHFDLSPDGARFVIVENDVSTQRASTQVNFFFNFFDELRRRAPTAGR